MSLETRSTSALFKRADQLKRWEESDTNREPVTPKQKTRKIKFSSGCVFLAACAAGDKKEVLELLHKGADINTANVDGLTALHQACIDDNLDMVEFLVENGADVNRGDNEGWTPLHATASCGFLSIAKYLIEKGAHVAAVNNDGQLAIDIAECPKMESLLREEIAEKGIDCDAARNEEELIMLRDAKDWLATKSSLVNVAHPKNGATALHVACAKGYTDVIKILLQCGADVDVQDVDGWTPLHAAAHWGQQEACQILTENLADMEAKNFVGQTAFDLCDTDMLSTLEDLRRKQNKEDVYNRRISKKRTDINDRNLESETPSKVKKVDADNDNKVIENTDMDVSSESESESETESESSSESESESSDEEKKNKINAISGSNEITTNAVVPKKIVDDKEEITSRRKITKQNSDLSPTKINNMANSVENSKSEPEITPRRPPIVQNEKLSSKKEEKEIPISTTTITNTTTNISQEKTSPLSSPQPTSNSPQFIRRSFVPPVRDEESETQRKAHAKRVRETRRSTQGVTLEEIKSAEQLVKQKNQPNSGNEGKPGANGDSPNGVVVTATITTGTPTVITTRESEEPPTVHERRPSWRLRVDNGTSKFLLEDASKPAEPPSTPSFIRRTNPAIPIQRPSSAPLETADTTITLPLRKPKTVEEKDQDKENDIRNAQATLATQAAIQRRRRPKRRSTGVVSFDNVDDLEQEKDSSSGKDCDDTTKLNHLESGTDRSSRSRISSSSDIRNENGEIDYKKLYEEQLAENERLKEKLRKSDEELRDTKQTLEKINLVTSKNSLSELEKRERRAMERKLSEMEEELKNLENLKSENQRLKDENGALIRVISKLSK
ncbi:protein phosphatase 1 regulatory subunit 12B isoform X5 [Diorhabda carinulata]|uniref:protein phosphatase 1 regulatory subunit 12B isoform X2 n=1 Tax=Diorhabda sublineata TaxID=1163346 RepID=UPI0024E13562|nr:protein phosphatase 1 regulatory subunit 12B isoform X2 [Diorhabda sublineata]XP_057651482.1 protein phosphatase 1 regulatory subunit 12B isoform X5 [Diorhabda carinulata]